MTIATLWDEFAAQFLPSNAPEMQRRHLRIAFFGGAAAALQIIATTDAVEPRRSELLENMAAVQVELGNSAMDGIGR